MVFLFVIYLTILKHDIFLEIFCILLVHLKRKQTVQNRKLLTIIFITTSTEPIKALKNKGVMSI
jgi:hypothetical protein